MLTKRELVLGAAAVGFGQAAFADAEALASAFARIEKESGGRLGVAVLGTQTGMQAGHRADERFPMCSTFKLLAAAAILRNVDAGAEHLQRRVRFDAKDLVTYSPVIERHIADGMTLAELCDTAVTLSDNTAGNLLLAAFGGPAGLTAFARLLGDAVTRLDRIEPELNEARPGDPRDTTSPAAMTATRRGDRTCRCGRDRHVGVAARSTGQRGAEEAWLANPLHRPYVSAADGCESGFAAFGHPATA
jgi:beta-lactamase class A